MWNVLNATKLGYGKINNISEGWTNKFQHLIRFRLPCTVCPKSSGTINLWDKCKLLHRSFLPAQKR